MSCTTKLRIPRRLHYETTMFNFRLLNPKGSIIMKATHFIGVEHTKNEPSSVGAQLA